MDGFCLYPAFDNNRGITKFIHAEIFWFLDHEFTKGRVFQQISANFMDDFNNIIGVLSW